MELLGASFNTNTKERMELDIRIELISNRLILRLLRLSLTPKGRKQLLLRLEHYLTNGSLTRNRGL